MRFHREFLKKGISLSSDSQTLIYDLPKSGVLSGIFIRFQATNGATSNQDNPVFKNISKIEVIANGSEVIVSANAEDLIKIYHFLEGVRPPELISEVGGAKQFNVIPILFGRFLKDEEYGLDCSKFTSLDLRITYDLETVRSCGTTGFVSGSGVLDIIQYRAPKEKAPAVKGFIKTHEIKSFTTAASGDKDIELPLGHPYMGLYVYCYESGVADGTDITELKIDVEDGTLIPFTAKWQELQEENAKFFRVDPKIEIVAFKTNDDTLETWTGTLKNCVLTLSHSLTIGTDDTPHYVVKSVSGGQITFQGYLIEGSGSWSANSADTTDRTIYVVAEGYSVGNAVYIPFFKEDRTLETFESGKYSKVELVLTQGGAGGACRVVLQELIAK